MSEELKDLKETGKLPVGFEINGEVHRDYVLLPRRVSHSIEALKDPRAVEDDTFRGVSLIAQQLEQLGSLPKEQITADLLVDALDLDMTCLLEAHRRLEVRLIKFRGQPVSEGIPGAGSDTNAGGLPAGNDQSHERSRSAGAAESDHHR